MADGNQSVIGELLARARDGDAEALERLFTACRNYLVVVARAQVETWLQAKVDASDVVQQTLLEAHRGFDRFQGTTEQEWMAWLRKILSHNATDFVRHWHGTQKRRVSREFSINRDSDRSTGRFQAELASNTETPSQQILRRERELLVADALSRLPPDYHEVIMLRNLQRLPFDEVAERMGRSRPATQMLWTRAIQKLRDQVADQP